MNITENNGYEKEQQIYVKKKGDKWVSYTQGSAPAQSQSYSKTRLLKYRLKQQT
jgi:hypothetical protein